MSCKVVIGTQWGDEGKAKMIDYFTRDSDIVVRYQGGANAGHTVVVNDNKYIFHLIPSGVLHKDKVCVIGNGMVVDPILLINELASLEEKGYDIKKRLLISDAAHLILPYHKSIDEAMEESRAKRIGTTVRGIGPSYADKCLRIGIRAGDVLDMKRLAEKMAFVLETKNIQLERIYNKPTFSFEEIMDILRKFKKNCGGMIANTQQFLHESIKKNKRILLEGAQGFALDIDHGTYPFVTSSNPTIGGALLGTGLNAFDINEVIGVAKAYVTRVGGGPFPTEAVGEQGDRMRVNGAEFGSTTGRPRRCGWFDVQLLKQTARINGLTSISLTKLDVLSGFKKIKVATGYNLDGKKINYFPASNLSRAKPIFKELDGWGEDITKCKKMADLPKNARKYIDFLESRIGVRITIISVGPERRNTFKKK
jgi:adenylosuccinate synthase